MRIKIYYMSGTGNTKRAAELFQLQLNSMQMECEIANWTNSEFEGWDEADAYGFATPTHAYREPTVFKKKLKSLPKIQNKKIPCFLITSCEGQTGNIFYRVGRVLQKKGINIVGNFTFFAPSNVLMWPKSIVRCKGMLTLSHQHNFMNFAKTLPVVLKENSPLKLKRKIGTSILARLVRDRMLRYMVRWKIKVDESKCVKCGICAKNCMAQCITLNPFPVVKMKKCVVCLSCINRCPHDAINSKNTLKEERYRGPGKLKVQPI